MVKIPNRLEDLYPASAIERILDVVNQQEIPEKVKNAISRVSSGEVNPLDQVQQAWQQARSWMDSLAGDTPAGEMAIVNASGMLLHDGLASVPGTQAITQLVARDSASFISQPVSLLKTEQNLANLFGKDRSCLSATVDAGLRSLIRGKTVFIAKADLVRIAMVGSVAAFLNHCNVIEVGLANGTTGNDWAEALKSVTDGASGNFCCIHVSPNAVLRNGADSESHSMMIKAAGERGVTCYGLLADAVVNETLAETHGFPKLRDWNDSGLDAVVAPLNVLMGATTGAIVLGNVEEAAKAKSALREIGSELAAPFRAAAVIALQLGAAAESLDAGALQGLVANPEALQERARRIAVQLDQNGFITSAKVVERRCPLGPAPWDQYAFSSCAVELESEDDLKQRFVDGWDTEAGRVSVLAAFEGEKAFLDLRFVDPKDDYRIVEVFGRE
ncbi:MAG: hypothetical protein ACE361_10585 [Aureliella sp.]